jgi:CubicO group peptidase (beta-lactamase class C family)
LIVAEKTFSSIARVLIAGIIAFSLSGCGLTFEPSLNTEAVEASAVPSQNVTKESLSSESVATIDTMDSTGFSGDPGLGEALSFMDISGFQGTVLIGKDSTVVYEKSFGYADVDEGVLNSKDTTYEIGFITKQFTAVGVMLLVEDGLIGLDNYVSDYLPEYSHAQEITVRQLLNMTSGIPDYLNKSIVNREYTLKLLEKGLTRSETMNAAQEYGAIDPSYEAVLALVNDTELSFEPGTEYEYSNTGYVFLAEIIARVSDIPYVHYMQKNVLSPLGLETASFEPSSSTASAYLASGKMQMLIPDTPMQAEAGLRMSANDLFNWSATILGSEFIAQESRDLILGIGPDVYGFGIEEDPDGNLKIDSAVGGFRCVQGMLPSTDLVIIILSNRNSDAEVFEQISGAVIEYYNTPD